MRLEKARDVLARYKTDDTVRMEEGFDKAVQLGSEGLALLVRWRDKAEIQPYPLLPSETTD